MTSQSSDGLAAKKCAPCEGGVTPYTQEQAQAQVTKLSGWSLSEDGQRIRKAFQTADFLAALAAFEKVGQIAEDQGHHPDLHLEGYRNVTIELWTHAIGGLSENDFIVAAKIDRLGLG